MPVINIFEIRTLVPHKKHHEDAEEAAAPADDNRV